MQQTNRSRSSVSTSPPVGSPFAGMPIRSSSTVTQDDANLIPSGPEVDSASTTGSVRSESETPRFNQRRKKSNNNNNNNNNKEQQQGLAANHWPDTSHSGSELISAPSNHYGCGQCEHGMSTPLVDPIPVSALTNGGLNTASHPSPFRPVFAECLGNAVGQLQPAGSTSIPDVRQSDVDRLKRLHQFTTQQARSVEELTRNQRKLDHLKRCLKRYDIERFEAGQAVRRIEDRLKELRERTADLLSTSMNSPGQTAVPAPIETDWATNWDKQARECSNTVIQPPTQAIPVGSPIVQSSAASARSSRIVRKPSKQRMPGHSMHTMANHLYVDSEKMLQSNPVMEVDSSGSMKALGDPIGQTHNPLSTWSNMTDPSELRNASNRETESEQPTNCACSQKQISLAQKRIAELEAHYKTLKEHLNIQRSRLVAADATVASLARALLQFTLKNGQGKPAVNVDEPQPPQTDKHSDMTHPYTQSVYVPQNNLVAQLRTTAMPGSMDSISRLQQMGHTGGVLQNGYIGSTIPRSTAVSSTSLNPTDWAQTSVVYANKRPNLQSTHTSPTIVHDYIDLSTTDSVDPVSDQNGYLPTATSHPLYASVLRNGLPTYFSSMNQLSGLADQTQTLHPPYFVHSSPPPPPRPPPLPPKPMQCELAPNSSTMEEEEPTVEDEEVYQYMSRSQRLQSPAVHVTQNDSRSSLIEACGTQRPPPPPYYVNLFGSDQAHATNQFSRTAINPQTKQAEIRQSSFDSDVTNATGQRSSRATTKTPETVIERVEPNKSTAYPIGARLDDAQSIGTIRMAAQGPESSMPITNFRDYLDAMGHDTKDLSCELSETSEQIWSRITPPAVSCFNSKLARWLRSGLPGSTSRSKPRHYSLDDKDSSSITPFWQWIGESRVRLTETRCEGFLWIRHPLTASPKSVQNIRPWHSLRLTSRAWPDAGAGGQSGRDSPSVLQSRLTRKWRQVQWIRQWFVCDVPGQLVTYHEPGKMERIKGSFRFAEIQTIHPGLSPNSDLPPGLSETMQPQYQSDPEGTCDSPRRKRQTRSNKLFHKHRTRTIDSKLELQQTDGDSVSIGAAGGGGGGGGGGTRSVNELNQLVFCVETRMQVYILKAATPALRNLWMDVFHYAVQSNGT